MKCLCFLLLYSIVSSYASNRFIREEPSNERFEFVGMCAPGSYNTLSVGGIEECEACETNTFFQRYMYEGLLYDTDLSVRHGKCCVNAHHSVCIKMREAYIRHCDECD